VFAKTSPAGGLRGEQSLEMRTEYFKDLDPEINSG